MAGLDDVLTLTRSQYPAADRIVVGWERRGRRLTVLGLTADGRALPMTAQALEALSVVMRVPFEVDVLRLAFPETDAFVSPGGTLDLDVDVSVWARVVENVATDLEQGYRVSDEDLRDASALAYEAVTAEHVSSMRLVRRATFPAGPADPVFQIVEVALVGGSLAEWGAHRDEFPPRAASYVEAMVSELAERRQHAVFPEILAEVTIPL